IETEDEVPYEAIDAGQVLAKMESARNPVNILILDACRNNPLERSFRSASRGLARMASPVGSLVLYATAPGKTAADGRGRNGIFTKHLMSQLQQPNLNLTDVVFNTRVAVIEETDKQQVPWSSSSLTRRVILNQTEPLDEPMLTSVSASLKLIIEPDPSDARIRILNIGPKYQSGMTLPAGRYHIEVSRAGYKTERKWVELSSERQVFAFALHEKQKALKPAPVVKPEAPARADEWRDPVTGMEFAWVPEGCFQMGSNEGDSDEKPVHEVCVDGFWMGKYEVTQGQWEKIMGDNPSKFKKGDHYPVEQVSWDDVQGFIKRLNAKGQGRFRLPTEAEWEYACRSGGKQEKYCGGNNVDRVAWYGKNSGRKTHPVGKKAANGLGLYDMSGNVWEWVSDWYNKNYYRNSPKNNPKGPSSGARRVLRGGGWYRYPTNVRAANRDGGTPGDRYGDLGFRLLRTNP
ncbi:MAG: SUMF1/EgtB/PvdO family nonheme iron enzyme, partial [Gammaproteobacteria bacterium]|nr:SUMF1/EgtB/PvdO family nonheme iron enzyme [Gammaproteobacteria bacterium]